MSRPPRGRPDEVLRLVQAVSRSTGLAFDGAHRRWMAEAVEEWWRRSGSPSASEQLARLEREPAAWDRLVDRLTIRETYFFRHHGQLQEIRKVIAAAGAAPSPSAGTAGTAAPAGRAPVQVWSAGCASGEEPYSLAILLDRVGLLDRCRIVGTDVSRAAIDVARSATYGAWSRRGDTVDQHARYFRRHGDRVRLEPRIAHAVRFVQRNLLDGPPGAATFDVIVCRNVLLHLQPEARHRAALVLRGALRPGGWLFVGASDPMPPLDGLVAVPTDHGLAFRPTDAVPAGDDPRSRARAGIDPPTTARAPSIRPRLGADPVPAPPPGEPVAGSDPAAARRPELAVRPRPASRRGPAPDTGSGTALSMASGTRLDARLGRAIAEAPLDPALRCSAARLHLQAGRADEAAAAARAAVYLDGSLAIAHLLLARAELARGKPDRARRSFTNAFELLRALPPEAEVPLSEGSRAGRLAATAGALAMVGA